MSGYLALAALEGHGGENGEMGLNNNEATANRGGGGGGRGGGGGGGGCSNVESLLPREELLAAVKSNDEPRLRHALQHTDPQDLDHLYGHPDFCSLLHIASQNNSPHIVRLLIEAGASPNLRDNRGKKFMPLHHAILNGHHEVIKILLEKGANVNAKEGEFGRTCLHLITSKWKTDEDDFRASLNELMKQKKIKVDSADSSGVTPLFLAAQKGWEYMVECLIKEGASLETKVGLKTTKEIIEKKLPNLLERIDFSTIKAVQTFYGDDLYEALKEENIDLFRTIMVEVNEKEKLSKNIILEEDHGEYTLLNYACDHGLHEFVELLLKEGADPTHMDDTTKLTPILLAAKNGYYKVMEFLIENMKKLGALKRGALKSTDRKGETALHKVVKREQPLTKEGVDYLRCLQILLNLKNDLDIDAKDLFDNTPLHFAVLCDDQSFVRDLLINGAHLGIENKFGTLAITRIQPSVLEEVLNECIKHRNNVTDRDFEIILHYSMLAPAQIDLKPETECLKFLSGSKPHRHLLRHPIIDTFLFLKWQRIRHYYFINLAAYSAYLILLTSYILLYYGIVYKNPSGEVSSSFVSENNSTNPENTTNFSDNMALKLFLQIFILIFWICGALREITQFLVSWKSYFSRPENWLELVILIMTIIVLLVPISYVSRQGLSAWLILCTWIEFVLILGRHPLFAVYITMFTTVTFNFLKFILMFSSMIVAFTISFYLVLQVDDNFITYPKTVLKTIAMSTGEIEYTELPLSDFPVSSHLLFVVFVFLIVLVLMNLLNGLAVSDIQLIKQEAEIVSYRSRVELISYIESVFLGNSFQPSGKKCGEDSCCFRKFTNTSNPVVRFMNYLGRRTLMFRNCLRDHQITMYPNRGKDRWFVCSCHSFLLEEAHIEAAKSVVISEEVRMSDRLTGLESRIDSMMSAIVSLTNIVQQKEINNASLD